MVKYKVESKTISASQLSAQLITFNNIMTLPTDTVNAASNALCKVAQMRAAELKKYDGKTLLDSLDDEKKVENQILKSFFN